MDEGSDDVGEVGQLLEVANGIPVGRFDPLIGIHGLVLPVDSEVIASFEEEVVLLLVDLL